MAEPHEGRELALVLPVPPSVNHQYATVNGRRVLSRDGRAYKALVVEEVEAWAQRQELTGSDLAGFGHHYLALTITFFFHQGAVFSLFEHFPVEIITRCKADRERLIL